MNPQKLIGLLLSEKVYDSIKENEEAIFRLLPELKVCKGFDQKNQWHVYDVYEHILHVVSGVEANRILRLTALFHDMGKPPAFHLDDQGVGHFYGHWDRSVEIFRKYKQVLNLPQEETDLIETLIFYHDVNVDRLTEEELLAMVERIGKENLGLLFAIKRADLMAQSPAFHGMITKLREQEQSLQRRFVLNNTD